MTKLSDVILRDTTANRPAAGVAGRLFYSTDDEELQRDSGSAWQSVEGATGGGGGGMTRISEVVLGSDAASIDFTSISGAYDELLIIWIARGTNSAEQAMYCRFNSDSGANYDTALIQNGSNTRLAAQTSVRCGLVAGTSAPSGYAGHGRIHLPYYAQTTWQKALMYDGGDRGGSASSTFIDERGQGWWRNTAAITSVSLFLGAGNFATGSRAVLYGLSG